jgi:hypothetical protein
MDEGLLGAPGLLPRTYSIYIWTIYPALTFSHQMKTILKAFTALLKNRNFNGDISMYQITEIE